ncbi:MAG: DUF4402 domain-containing protein [Alphaproteobacteria bacterium]|nr:DUF4402 domain-containing protein [Alphaproteobacteria bacterium]
MNIKKIDMKKTLLAGSAMAVMSGAVPPVINEAIAGTATVPIDVQIVTAVNLANTNGLDFGRLAITGAMTGTNHTLSPAGVTTTGAGYTVAVAGTPGDLDITAGTNAANVQVSYPASVTYNAGNIVMNRITVGGVAFTANVQVAGGGTATGSLAGGGNTAVDIGGRLNFVANPAVGTYNGNNATLAIIDIP